MMPLWGMCRAATASAPAAVEEVGAGGADPTAFQLVLLHATLRGTSWHEDADRTEAAAG